MPRQDKHKRNPERKADAILCADIHLSPQVPKCRDEEEYIPAMLGKLEAIRDLQARHGGIPVLCAGDVTDKWYLEKGDQWFVTEVIKRMSNWIAVPGQHDLPQHSLELYDKSWLATLEEAGCIYVSKEHYDYFINNTHYMQAFSWGREPEAYSPRELRAGTRTKPGTLIQDPKKIALIHRMVYQGKPPYPGADKDGGTAKALLRKMKGFDLIVSGDNHETFVEELNGRLLVNPGSMMRTSAKQIDHEPCVFLWFAEDNTVKRVTLPHNRHAVSREHLDHAEAHDSRMSAFVEKLRGDVDLSIGFKENVVERMKGSDISKETKDIVMEVIE
jgi:predicted phosphodiesterase